MTPTTSPQGILVTGATGRHGGTSAYVVKALIEAGHKVRALARTHNERTSALSKLGAEIALGDFTDRRSLMAAMDGVELATFTYPVAGGIVPAAATFAAAAREVQPQMRVIAMSMAVAHPDSPSHLGRAQWLAEEILAWSGVNLTVLRVAALFFENITTLHAQSIREQSEFSNSFASAKVPWISGLDAARLMTAAILRPGQFADKSIHYPPGVELLAHSELAAILSSELGRPIQFNAVDQERWSQDLAIRAQDKSDGVITHDMAKHIPAVGAALNAARAPIRAPDAAELQRLTGAPPIRFRDFVAANIDLFGRTA